MKKKNFKSNFIYSILLLIFTLAGSAFLLYQSNILYEYNNKLNDIEQKISSAEEETTELLGQMEYKTSNEYIEKMAREKLGMVRPDEIVFIDLNK